MYTKELKRPRRLMADPDALTYNYGKFTAEPLSRGFGTTLGNALRRVLLSSLTGAAITAIKIESVLHEFTTMPGVVEDVTQMVLNLKEIRFRLLDDGPVTLLLDIKGVGEITAADIQPNSRVEIMNPDQHIATLDSNGALSMEIYVDSGRGYVPAELNKDEESVLGVIPMDSIFSPIRKANYYVEDLRVDMMDCDRLFLEVWTDGTINAKDAVAEAARTLADHLDMFIDFDESYIEPVQKVDVEMEQRKAFLSKPVAELELSVRSANCLEAADIITIKDLVTRSEAEMLKFRNFGRKSLNEIKTLLTDMGLSFGMMMLNSDEPEEVAEDSTDAS